MFINVGKSVLESARSECISPFIPIKTELSLL